MLEGKSRRHKWRVALPKNLAVEVLKVNFFWSTHSGFAVLKKIDHSKKFNGPKHKN